MNQFKGYEKIKRWRRGNVACSLYDFGYDYTFHKNRVGYRFTWKGQVIFEGDDFFPSPFIAIDSVECVYALLGFLTLRPGDADSEFFKDYGPVQFDWCNSQDCENLQCWAGERER